MKKPRARLARCQEKRRKKKEQRRLMLKAKQQETNKKKEEDKPSGLAPRFMRRRKDLEGLTYWRGARSVLLNH